MIIPVIFGTIRVPGNLIWAGDFIATPHMINQVGGKGGMFGAGQGGTADYTYSESFMQALCEGPITGIMRCWRDKREYSMPPSDIAIFTGTYPQTPWTYLNGINTTVENWIIDATTHSVTWAAGFNSDLGVLGMVQSGGGWWYYTPLTKVGSSPAQLQYSVSAGGVYTFNILDIAMGVCISYSYVRHASAALSYAGIAYIAAANVDIGKTDALPNMSYEVEGFNLIGGGLYDANPKDIITEIVTNVKYGLGLSSSFLDLSDYAIWCLASNLILSAAFNSQKAAREQIQQILDETFSTAIWHDCSALRVIPFGDTQMIGNGQTWNPNVTPAYDLTDDDFIGIPPIKVRRKSPAEAFNNLKIECVDRTNNYNPSVSEFMDQGAIDTYLLRANDTKKYPDICQASIGHALVQLAGQRGLYIRNEYEFILGWRYCLLEPMDIVTLTDSGLGLSLWPVRIMRIDENESGEFDILAEDFPQGVGHAATYQRQTSDGYNVNYNLPPPPVNPPYIFNAPWELAETGYEVWVALSGSGDNWGGADVYMSMDNSTYKFIGRILGGGRYGFLTDVLNTGADPDTINTLKVDMTASEGFLLSGTQADADNLITLCLVDDELLSYQTATLTATYKYSLTYLRRGVLGTFPLYHAPGARFIRLDDTLLKIPFNLALNGKGIYLKFCSFNQWQGATQSLADAIPYSYILAADLGEDYTTYAGGGSEKDLGWPGTLTNFVQHWTGVLTPKSQNLASADGWDTFDKFVSNPYATCTYEVQEISLDTDVFVFVSGPISAHLGPGETTGAPRSLLQTKWHKKGDAYNSYQDWTISEIEAQAIMMKFTLTPAYGNCVIDDFKPTLSAVGIDGGTA